MILKRAVPAAVAITFGLTTLVGLLFVPPLSRLILDWMAFLAAVALVLGIVNLFAVHLRRSFRRNGYSLLLLLSMVAVFALAVTDEVGITEGWVDSIFFQIQVPLEAALASLLAFFLLFAGIRLLQRQRNVWSVLFLLTAIFLLFSQSPLPSGWGAFIEPVRTFINGVLVTAGMRGLLLGIALGTIMLSLRLLAGVERPYSS